MGHDKAQVWTTIREPNPELGSYREIFKRSDCSDGTWKKFMSWLVEVWLERVCYAKALSTMLYISRLILMMILRRWFYYYPNFIDEETND